jgi:thioredoxin 1
MASKNIKVITDASFHAEVLSSDKPTLIDFWAPWCGPCRAIAPYVEALAEQYADKLVVGKMDIDDNQMTPTKYEVRSIPTLLIFHRGKVIGQKVGGAPKNQLENFIKDTLAKISN